MYAVLGRSMLARAAMPVVFVLAETIRRGTGDPATAEKAAKVSTMPQYS